MAVQLASPAGFVVPDVLPVLPLRDAVVFPLTAAPLVVGQPRSVRLVDDVMRGNRLLALVAQRDPTPEPATPDVLYRVGTVGMIHQLARGPEGSVRLMVQGIERIKILDWTGTEPYLVARVEAAPDQVVEGTEVDALRRAAADIFRRLVEVSPELPDELGVAAESFTDPRHLLYFVASLVPLDLPVRQELLETDPVPAKLRRLVDLLQRELAVRELGQKITSDTEERLSKKQREYYLREQLRSIQRELGEDREGDAQVGELRRRIEEAGLPDEARREAERELTRLAGLSPSSPEHGMIGTYLEWMASLPWSKVTGGTIDIGRAREVLDQDHFDLEKIKDRLLDYLAVKKLRQERGGGSGGPGPGDSREPILCFVGPPGVGKTSLGQSIARALGRQFARMSLGGVRDEAEIRGHRRTYIGALPGRIIQAIRRAETRDPVFMLDEIDKIGADWRGDPSAGLLEVLDPAQNNTFVDHYLGVPFDLSQVLFIATANTLETIPGPLRDRMEILTLSGYTDEEKIGIARQYLIPKQLAAHGLTPAELSFEPEAIRQIVRGYTREAGVRSLEREIAAAARKVARRVAEGQSQAVRIIADQVTEYLGRPRFFDEVAERTSRPGVATGLAWTPAGGDVLFVEATMMPSDEERLVLTGMLGDVMRESAQAAVSYVRSNAEALAVDPETFEGRTIHVHVPAGAIPKDGPSAGVTIMTALASLATRRPVRSGLAMTGEITLRGKVLPVGGIKEKVLAAHRAGIRSIILPARNERDVEDVPEELRRQLTFIFVDDAAEVLRHALTDTAAAVRPGAR
ncbi:MAG TPA: endopeptidase La [Candidatus Deferrimicrobiaceae bacterium]|nr:endopeptidase La [Candidatus Deferrimicrobiaceae bacterium]